MTFIKQTFYIHLIVSNYIELTYHFITAKPYTLDPHQIFVSTQESRMVP